MSELRMEVMDYIEMVEENKLQNVLDFLDKLLYGEETPLDDFDWELSRRADATLAAIARGEERTYTLEEVLAENGMTLEDL
ncbi:MAG: hypothetical protein LBE35_10440, partial [Clostridiales bacterium]|nr:hypothetical protein [Clostridiales bacterium]